MKKKERNILFMFSRYFSILLIGLGDLYLIYKLISPLTIKVLYFILSIFRETTINGNIILFNNSAIEIIPACVAGAAYYLLFVLIMVTPMDVRIRAKAVLGALLGFFIANMFRLLILTFLIQNPSFELIHWIFWHLVSTIFVVGIWVGLVKIFRINAIPLCSDLKELKKYTKRK